MNTLYYNQVLNNRDRWVPTKSRTTVLTEYFKKYLPSFTSNFPQIVDRFIKGELSYEYMLTIFENNIPAQKQRQNDKIYSYLREDRKKWGDRSMPPIPEKYERTPLKDEKVRFIEVFWPEQIKEDSRVPWTIKTYSRKVNAFTAIWAW